MCVGAIRRGRRSLFGPTLELADLRVDCERRNVRGAGRMIELTSAEFDLLELLLRCERAQPSGVGRGARGARVSSAAAVGIRALLGEAARGGSLAGEDGDLCRRIGKR